MLVTNLLLLTFWGIIELIIKESGNGGSDGKGRTSTPLSCSMLSPLIINPLMILACLQLLQIVCSPLSLGKSCRRGSVTNVFVRVRGGGRPGCEGVRT